MLAIRSLPEAKTCPAPAYARAFEQRIVEKLRKQGFSDFDIEAGLKLLRRELGLPVPQWLQPIGPAPAGMREGRPEEVRRGAINTARVYEEQFLKAERSGDVKGMEDAAERYYQLLNEPLPQGSGDPMPGRLRMQSHREELEKTRAEILRQAPNLASIVRNLGRLDLNALRGKISEHVRQRHVLRQQRSRTRR